MRTRYHKFFYSAKAVLLAVLLAALLPAVALAQLVNGHFTSQVIPGAGTGGVDQYLVTLQLQADPTGGTFDFGSATLRLFFDPLVLSIPSNPGINGTLTAGTDYDFLNYNGFIPPNSFYSNTVTRPQQNELSVNMVLSTPNNGVPLPTNMTNIINIKFDIAGAPTAPLAAGGLAWHTDPPNETEIFLEDNLTRVPNGTFGGDDTLPVELTTFDAKMVGETAVLTWVTASETNNAGFAVEYRDGADETFDWTQVAYVEGRGTTTEAQSYSHRMDGLEPGRHLFRLKQVDFDGAFEYTPEVELYNDLPDGFLLSDAYPNPFNPQTRFNLQLQVAQQVKVAVYNLLGRQVMLLHDGTLAARTPHAFTFDAANLPSGLYLYRVSGETFNATRTAMLLK